MTKKKAAKKTLLGLDPGISTDEKKAAETDIPIQPRHNVTEHWLENTTGIEPFIADDYGNPEEDRGERWIIGKRRVLGDNQPVEGLVVSDSAEA